MSEPQSTAQIWTAPILLGLSSAIGLATALFSDGIGDYVAWVALGVPVAVSLWGAWRFFVPSGEP